MLARAAAMSASATAASYASCMTSGLTTALLTGAFGLGGVLGGVLLTSHFAQRADQRRIASEDQRRWLADRRQVYAHYLAIITSMLRSIHDTSGHLDGEMSVVVPSGEAILEKGVFDFQQRWDNELLPALSEVELLAEPKVAKLAYQVAWVLIQLNRWIESREKYEMVSEYEDKTHDLVDDVRNAVRAEIGLTSSVSRIWKIEDWPFSDEPKAADDSTPSGAESPTT